MNNDILYLEKNNIAYITLNRTSKHNAFSAEHIAQLTQLYEKVNHKDNLQLVVLKANGQHFSAGADLNWMRRVKDFNLAQNEHDAMQLTTLLKTINYCKKPTIAITQGKVMGGAIGLLACCDFVLAHRNTKLCFSEVTLGLIPATIAPYIIRKIGFSLARSYFLSAELIDAEQAKACGLIYQIAQDDQQLEDDYQALSQRLLSNAAQAMSGAKQLLELLVPITDETINLTAKMLAQARISDEAQLRLTKFLNKDR
jgi:methylglutaconyl-CoA hydratase